MATVSPSCVRSPDEVEELADAVGLKLASFQREILEALAEGMRELLVLLPRGNGKTTLFAVIALYEVLMNPRAAVYCAAASRDQASILFDVARGLVSAHPDIEERVTVTRRELRAAEGYVKVLAVDAPKVHGLMPTLALVDELHAHRDDDLYLALRTAMLKRPGAQMVTISTAGTGAETPLGRLRARALGLPSVSRSGALTRAQGPTLAMLEWSVPEGAGIDDLKAAKAANPAPWIDEDGLLEQREAVPELAYRRFHLNQWVARIGSWLPAGAWQACAGDTHFEDGERIWVGVDIGGSRADSAVVWVNERLHVGVEVFSGDDAILDVAGFVPELAERHWIQEAVFDPWRASQMAAEWEQRGIVAVEFPQSDPRMIPASQALFDAITGRRLVHPDDPRLNAHIAAAVARHTRRGWRLDRAERGENIDGAVALCMAVERAVARPAPVELVGWL